MTIFLDKIDAAPVLSEKFDYPFNQWLSVLVNTLNETLGDIQTAFNLLQAQSYTTVEIAQLETDLKLVDGVILYDSTLNVYVGYRCINCKEHLDGKICFNCGSRATTADHNRGLYQYLSDLEIKVLRKLSAV